MWKEESARCRAEGVAMPPRPIMVMQKDVWAGFDKAHSRGAPDGASGDRPEGSSDSNGGSDSNSGGE